MKTPKRKIKGSVEMLIALLLIVVIGIMGVIIWGEVTKQPTIFDPMVSWLEKAKNQTGDQVFVTRRERLSDSEKAIFRTPTASSSASDQKSYYETVERQSVTDNKLVIEECMGSPLALKVSKGTEIEIQNNDTHVIKIRLKSLVARIEGRSTGNLKIDLEQTGVYIYSCENSIGRVFSGGAILVI